MFYIYILVYAPRNKELQISVNNFFNKRNWKLGFSKYNADHWISNPSRQHLRHRDSVLARHDAKLDKKKEREREIKQKYSDADSRFRKEDRQAWDMYKESLNVSLILYHMDLLYSMIVPLRIDDISRREICIYVEFSKWRATGADSRLLPYNIARKICQ